MPDGLTYLEYKDRSDRLAVMKTTPEAVEDYDNGVADGRKVIGKAALVAAGLAGLLYAENEAGVFRGSDNAQDSNIPAVQSIEK